jgi:leucyl-tRNA synthetase
MMPHLAEECWSELGREGLLALSSWPVADRGLIVDDSVTLPVQINGKKRAELTVPRAMSEAEVQAAVLALDAVQQALEGRAPKKIIVVPQRIVNVVA